MVTGQKTLKLERQKACLGHNEAAKTFLRLQVTSAEHFSLSEQHVVPHGLMSTTLLHLPRLSKISSFILLTGSWTGKHARDGEAGGSLAAIQKFFILKNLT